jgi:purine-binding chemotaxis protein CheW
MAQDVQLVIFRLASEDYGLPIQKVQEINRIVPVTRLPQTPEFMEGIINLRGRIIPVVDLRKRFGLQVKPHEEDTRIMIIDINGQTVGIIVDAVNEVVQMPGSSIEPPPPAFILDAQYIEGVGKLEERLIILLNIDQVMTSQEAIQLKQAVQETVTAG